MLYINARFLAQDLTGVQRFAEQISMALNDIRDDIVFLVPKNVKRNALLEKVRFEEVGERQGHLWEQLDLPAYLKKKGSPILLNLCSTAPIFYRNQIVTHHDVTYKRYPKSFSRKFRALYSVLIPAMLKNSKRLITVSEFSRNEINEVYHCPKEKIAVVYNAVSGEFHRKPDAKINNYLLAVSSPNYHKNFHGMLEAFARLPKDSGVSLKIIGKSATTFAAQDFSKLINGSDDIQFMGRVDDKELIELYQNALAFVFPSFYEGFGIPPLEAQACGCPVIAAKAASMPEVLADSVVYFDPNNISDIAAAMESIITDASLREALIAKGERNVARFSWHRSAEKVDQILREIQPASPGRSA
ncbi:glycosyltransferase family 4 protein [Serratia nevei]|uniref:glycosyltransferase family 4 protein n=1 Tax=Serratia nevei TaxID=2703794 RepID=UPI0020A17CFA|nr:glycosyltransferase family 1 protein [Serratia nevei]MCP1104995.1 glycosyltransferase family 4 protein [Serratia nevei]